MLTVLLPSLNIRN